MSHLHGTTKVSSRRHAVTHAGLFFNDFNLPLWEKKSASNLLYILYSQGLKGDPGPVGSLGRKGDKVSLPCILGWTQSHCFFFFLNENRYFRESAWLSWHSLNNAFAHLFEVLLWLLLQPQSAEEYCYCRRNLPRPQRWSYSSFLSELRERLFQYLYIQRDGSL